MRITVDLDDDVVKIVEKRAKKNLFSIEEQVEDIVRRSCVSYGKNTTSKIDVDDKLVGIFSRERRGKQK